MKKISIMILILLTTILCGVVQSAELNVEYIPKNPRAGESFQIIYVVSGSDLDDFIDVSFEPQGFEILGKDSRTSSTRTTYINGKLTTYKSQRITYDVFASSGNNKAIIRNLNLKMKTEKIEYSDIVINLDTAIKSKDVFVKAEVDKTNLYVGEGTKVTYYLYSKTNSSGIELRKFPVLKGFLKRFGQNKFFTEKQEVEGEIYDRTYLYSAYIFPQKAGTLEVDSLTVSARIATEGRRRETFDVFGFSFGSTGSRVRKVMRSEPISIKVNPLPASIPVNFSGLVGKHNFQFNINKTRFLANEPIEIKLTVSGEGELEGFDAPKIFKETEFEKFDSDGRLSLGDSLTSRKEFSYTYLAKVSGLYPARTLEISTFDPLSKSYEKHQFTIPELKVAGGVVASNKGKTVNSNGGNLSGSISSDSSDNSGHDLNQELEVSKETGIYAPLFYHSSFFTSWKKSLSRGLLALVLISCLVFFIQTKEKKELSGIQKYAYKLKGKRWKYSDLYMFLDYLRVSGDDRSIPIALENSNLTPAAKKYFKKLLDGMEKKEFSENRTKGMFKVNSTYVNEVVQKAEDKIEHLS